VIMLEPTTGQVIEVLFAENDEVVQTLGPD
jgi:hypothetical protein